MERKEKKGKKGGKGKVALKDLEVGKVKGGVDAEDPKGGAMVDYFLKVGKMPEQKNAINPLGKAHETPIKIDFHKLNR